LESYLKDPSSKTDSLFMTKYNFKIPKEILPSI